MRQSFIHSMAIAVISLSACSGQPAVIFQISDPQMGFKAGNMNMEYESDMLSEAVTGINNVRPDAVVFTGDLVHNPADTAQWKEFLRIVSAIDKGIPVFFIPGNHDAVTGEGTADMAPYLKHIGDDRFSREIKGVLLTGINSDLIKYTAGSAAEQEQKAWTDSALTGNSGKKMSIVFSHHPFFLKSPDEPEEYFNIRPDVRHGYLEMFRNAGVDGVFCGHLHDNSVSEWDGIPMVTTSAVGLPLGEAASGIRIIVCSRDRLYHRYFPVGEIPADRQAAIRSVTAHPDTPGAAGYQR